jgi:hypothetical protein
VTDRAGASWFSDEIAVDFPSMTPLIDRVRAGFFGAEHEALSAEVSLTARQAVSGAPLRVQVPLSHTCPICGGRGEVWTGSCGICEGRGVAQVPHEIQIAAPAGLRDGMRLRYIVEPSFAPATVLEIRFIIR